MAPTAMILAIAALASLAFANAGPLSGNLNYLTPIHEVPSMAKFEPAGIVEAMNSRRLLAADPSKSAWRATTNRETDIKFPQSVASGDPYSKSVILWTRVETTKPNKAAALDWAVATDRQFKKIVSRGTTFTDKSVDFTAKVEAKKLKPFTKYFYQWRYRENAKKDPVYSPIGRTRTIPRPNDDVSRIKIGVFGCSNLPVALFTAYGQIARDAQRGNIDYNIHTGDYIYEYATNGSALFSPEDQKLRTHKPAKEILSVDDYRTRHKQYDSDVDTKAMRSSAPLIPVWDDHEYTNDAWKNGAQNHQPATEGDWNERRLRALQVYYEFMPIRQVNADNKQQIYRNFEMGKLLKLIMLDTRVIGRDKQDATRREDPTRTILGPQQKKFLFDQLSTQDQTWKVIGQQVLFSHRCFPPGATGQPSSDQWDGYRQDQRDVLNHIGGNKIDNTIILTGDIHTHWANDVPLNPCFNEPNFNYNNVTGAGSLAVEFVSSSITSGWNPTPENQAIQAQNSKNIRAANPHVKYQESYYKGYLILDIQRKQATSTWYFAPELYKRGQYETKIQGESWRVLEGTNHLVKA